MRLVSGLALLVCGLLVLPAGGSGRESSDIGVRLSAGRIVTLVPFRAGAQCGVAIGGRRLTIIGAGETEAYACVRLVEAGALPRAAGRERIGLIYDVASPNARFRTAAVLVEGADGWALDAEVLGRYDDTPAARSLAALARALERGR